MTLLAMESLSGVPAGCRALVTDEASADALRPYAESCGWELFAGPAEDVLRRFVLACDHFGIETVVRSTADNPLVDSLTARLLMESHLEASADYSGYDGPPLGTGVEIVEAEALRVADKESSDPYDHEHVSPYLYRNPERFRINRIKAPEEYCLEGSSVTVDTREDFDYIERLFSEIYNGKPPGLKETIAWLDENRRQI